MKIMYFQEWPFEVQLQILIQCEDCELRLLRNMQELNYIFRYPHLERLFKERSEKYFSQYILNFRHEQENVTWEQFYIRISNFLNRLKTLTEYENEYNPIYLPKNNLLIEMKIYFDLYPNRPINRSNAYYALIHNQIDVLKWLVSKNVFPTVTSINAACALNCLETLKYLATIRTQEGLCIPTQRGADKACEIGKIQTVIWLEQYKILPSIGGANEAAKNNNIEILDWLYERNILPNKHGFLLAKKRELTSVILWFRDKGIYSEGEFMPINW